MQNRGCLTAHDLSSVLPLAYPEISSDDVHENSAAVFPTSIIFFPIVPTENENSTARKEILFPSIPCIICMYIDHLVSSKCAVSWASVARFLKGGK